MSCSRWNGCREKWKKNGKKRKSIKVFAFLAGRLRRKKSAKNAHFSASWDATAKVKNFSATKLNILIFKWEMIQLRTSSCLTTHDSMKLLETWKWKICNFSHRRLPKGFSQKHQPLLALEMLYRKSYLPSEKIKFGREGRRAKLSKQHRSATRLKLFGSRRFVLSFSVFL